MKIPIKKMLVTAVLVMIAVWPMSFVWGTTHDVHEGQIQVELTEGSADTSSTEDSSSQDSSSKGGQSSTRSSGSNAAVGKKSDSFLKTNEAVSYLGTFVGGLLLIFSLYFIVRRQGVNKNE